MTFTTHYDGTGPGNIIRAQWWTEIQQALTGIMTDQSYTLTYSPSSSTSLPTLTLTTNGNAPLFQAKDSSGTVRFQIDSYGNLQTYGNVTLDNGKITTDGSGNLAFSGGSISGLKVTGGASLDSATILTDGAGNITKVGNIKGSGKFGVTTDGDILDGSSPTATYIKVRSAGSFIFQTPNGTAVLTINSSGDITQAGKILGNLLSTGKFGVTTAGDVLDASGFDTYLKARGTTNIIHMQVNGSDVATFSPSSAVINSSLSVQPGNVSTPGAIIGPNVGLGFKRTDGTKLAEMKGNGNFYINGTTFYTTQSSVSYASGGSMDGFDVSEVYPTDANYIDGTVVCPGPNSLLTRCTHDNCPKAMIVSKVAGFCMGERDEEKNIHPIALAGRVKVRTATQIKEGFAVVSDGRGGVRVKNNNKAEFVLGFTLNDTDADGTVGMFIRSFYC